MSWTTERVTLLKRLWGEGQSAAEIAKQLGQGVTRNAVIGKAHRLKLSNRISPVQQNTKKPDVKAPAVVKVKKMVRAAPPPVIVRKGGIKMTELRETMCRWPYGDPKEENFLFCGCAAMQGLPYCEDHARVAYHVNVRNKPIVVDDYDGREPAADEDGDVKTVVGA